MDIPAPTPRHTLHQRLTEVVERNRHLHPRIHAVLIIVTQQHHLVVMREIIVGDSDRCGPHYGIDQTVRAVRQGAVVDPDLVRREQGDAVAVRYAPPPRVGRGGPHDGVARGLAVVDVDVVDDNVRHVLECDAAVAGYVDFRASAVDGLEVVEDELVLQLYGHVRREYNPVFFLNKKKSRSLCV